MMPFPLFRPVAEHAVLVEFGTEINAETHAKVLHLDAMLQSNPPFGFHETVPAYVNLLVEFDPVFTDHRTIIQAIETLIARPDSTRQKASLHHVDICYDADLAPDLEQIAKRSGLSQDAAIAVHLAGDYSVFLYGFAPGYAYLGGVPKVLQHPRKETALRGVAAGSVIIAGAQCIVTTLTMPTGWWIIGRSPTQILRDDPARPFLFDVGDHIRFRRIDRATYESARP